MSSKGKSGYGSLLRSLANCFTPIVSHGGHVGALAFFSFVQETRYAMLVFFLNRPFGIPVSID